MDSNKLSSRLKKLEIFSQRPGGIPPGPAHCRESGTLPIRLFYNTYASKLQRAGNSDRRAVSLQWLATTIRLVNGATVHSAEPQGLKPLKFPHFSARLKPCPDEKSRMS